MQQEIAYDLSLFENTEPKKALRVAKPEKQQKPHPNAVHLIKLSFMSVIFLTLSVIVLNSNAKLTEISNDIVEAKAQLSDAQADYNYYNTVLDSQTNITKIEEFATQQLGLIKMNKSQIEYVTLSNENKIEKNASAKSSFFENLSQSFMSIMEYIAP